MARPCFLLKENLANAKLGSISFSKKCSESPVIG